MKKGVFRLAGAGAMLLCALPVCAQTANAPADATSAANQTANTAGQVANAAAGQVPGTVSAVGNTATGVVGGLQPTLQPVTQGVGGALNNLTQPDNISSLLEFLSSVVPNHIEAHVNLDALRVDKLTIDVRGVDLRNLKVDLLVANSRNAGQVRPAMSNNSKSPTNASATAQPLTFTAPQNQDSSQNTGQTAPQTR